jgi:hypothetical protein
MRWNSGVNVICVGVVVFYQPRGSRPSLSNDRLLDKGAQHGLCENSTIATNVFVSHNCFFIGVFDVDKIARHWQGSGAIRQYSGAKGCLVSDEAMSSITAIQCDRHLLTGVIVMPKFVVDYIDKTIQT